MENSFFKCETQDALQSMLGDVKGYFKSISLTKAIEANLPELLAENELSLEQICSHYGWNPVSARLLCDTLVTMGWFEVSDAGNYKNSEKMLRLLPELPKLAPLLDDWARGMTDMGNMSDFLYRDSWSGGRVSEKYSYTQGLATKEETDKYCSAMFDSVGPMADSLTEKIDFSLRFICTFVFAVVFGLLFYAVGAVIWVGGGIILGICGFVLGFLCKGSTSF